MWPTILSGISYGLFLAILVGPLLVSLINTSIKLGYKKGLAVAVGIWISDLLVVLILLNLSKEFNTWLTRENMKWMAIFAAISFLLVGFLYLFRGRNNTKESKLQTPNTYFWQAVKGFLINTINPFTFVFWTTLAANHFIVKEGDTFLGKVFFSTILVMIVITDIAKVFLAHKISSLLQSRALEFLRYLSAIIFIVSGFYILYKFFVV